MKRGFTLVELSIVLVIIGLLIGGILVAQSMISTSRIVAVAAQIQQFDAGVENFKTKYNALPGDAVASGGDGDGAIDCAINAHSVAVFDCEHATFWNNIDPQQFTNTTNIGLGVKTYISGPNKNVPASKLGQTNSFFVASALSSNGYNANLVTIENYYVLLGPTQVQTQRLGYYRFTNTTALNSAVMPADMLSLDKKLDDGLADSGNVKSARIDVNDANGLVATPTSGICSIGPSYYITHSGYECTPMIRIGSQTGDPQ